MLVFLGGVAKFQPQRRELCRRLGAKRLDQRGWRENAVRGRQSRRMVGVYEGGNRPTVSFIDAGGEESYFCQLAPQQ
jgi:hypothetical protein